MITPATHIWKPSTARTVVLDTFIPVPRGSAAIASAPLNWPAKDPADVLDYQFDISPALVGNEAMGLPPLTLRSSRPIPATLR